MKVYVVTKHYHYGNEVIKKVFKYLNEAKRYVREIDENYIKYNSYINDDGSKVREWQGPISSYNIYEKELE